MDQQNDSVKNSRVRAFLASLWGAMFVFVYGITCAFLGMFSRDWPQFVGRQFMIHFLWLGGIKLKIEGREKLNKRECYLFYSNHQGMLDIPLMSASVENGLVFIAKKELFMIPLMGWGMRAMGHVAIDRSSARKAKESFSQALIRLKREKLSLILFPEGTRSEDGTLGEFKQGSFGVAFEAGVRPVPVAIKGASACLPKKKLLLRPGNISIKFGDPIDPTGMDKHSLMLLVREKIATALGQSVAQ